MEASPRLKTLLIAAALAAWPAVLRAEVADRIVSVVGETVVTESDLGFEEAFAEHDVSPLPPFERADADLLQRLEDYRILRTLAADVDVFRPPPGAVDARLEAFKESWSRRADYEAFLERWGMDEARLREAIYARLVIERYVARNLGLTPDDLTRPDEVIERYEAFMQRRRPLVPERRLDPLEAP
ncbi:MAG: hypothetical protein H6739_11510 [Alphaproteobacteria bacterium]|nr:hypothetical protein [Alphaproteobacteria bacterium]